MTNYDIIKKPLITEKTMKMKESNRYTFEVHKNANKIQIKNAVEKIFKVKVIDVTTLNMPQQHKRVGKHEGMTQAYKKAYVTLKTGDKISQFDV